MPALSGGITTGVVEECMKKFFPGHSTFQISHLLSALNDICTDGSIPAEYLKSAVDPLPWPHVTSPLETFFDVIAMESWSKYQECISAICSGITQKSTLAADGETRMVNFVDIQAALNLQNISQPDTLFAQLQQSYCGCSRMDDIRMPLQFSLDFMRMNAKIRLSGWYDLGSGIDYCTEQGAKVGIRSLGSLPEVE